MNFLNSFHLPSLCQELPLPWDQQQLTGARMLLSGCPRHIASLERFSVAASSNLVQAEPSFILGLLPSANGSR